MLRREDPLFLKAIPSMGFSPDLPKKLIKAIADRTGRRRSAIYVGKGGTDGPIFNHLVSNRKAQSQRPG
jgi:hypothetical protein